jgi:DNA-binding CsgD family transcriptional regulator
MLTRDITMGKTIKSVNGVSVSEKEIYLVRELADDVKRKEMAEAMGKSVRTIEANIDSLRHKLGLRTAAGLVAFFLRNKLIK